MNACGIDDFHDGVNYTRTACVIAVSKARDMFEPFLHQARALFPSLRVVMCGACLELILYEPASVESFVDPPWSRHAVYLPSSKDAAPKWFAACAVGGPRDNMFRIDAWLTDTHAHVSARSWGSGSATCCGACCQSQCTCSSATASS